MRRSSVVSRTALVGVLLVVVGLTGCGLLTPSSEEAARVAPPATPDREAAFDAVEAPSEAPQRMADAGTDISATGDTAVAASMLAAAEAAESRRVIRTAELGLEVDNLEQAQKRVLSLVEERGGFIASLKVNDYETYHEAKITARVPATHFHEVYEQVKALGEVRHDHIDGQDVTEEFVDLERRIANLQAQEQRVREMFDEAQSVEDLLKIEQRLTEVRGQTESLQGRLRYLKDQVGFSTLTISLHEYGDSPVHAPAGWRLSYHVRGAWRSLRAAVQSVVTALIYLVITGSIVWVPLLTVILLIRRWAHRRREMRAQSEEPNPTESMTETDAQAQ